MYICIYICLYKFSVVCTNSLLYAYCIVDSGPFPISSCLGPRIQGGSSSHRPRSKSLSVQKGALVSAVVISRSLW